MNYLEKEMLDLSTLQPIAMSMDEEEITAAIRRVLTQHGQVCARLSRKFRSVMRGIDRRLSVREKVEIPFYLHPVVHHHGRLCLTDQKPAVGVVCDISHRGIGFRFDAPLQTPFVVAEFDSLNGQTENFVIEIVWRQSKGYRAFTGGGMFIGLVQQESYTDHEEHH